MTERVTFENTLLGLLYGGPAHGYDLAAHFSAEGDLASVGRLAKSQLYALLKNLEGEGFAEGEKVSPGAAPTRTVYSVTEAGRERFLGWVRRPADSVRGLRVEFLLKLYFLDRYGLEGKVELMDAQREVLKRRLESLERAETPAKGVGPWVRALQEGLLRAGIEWLTRWRDATPAPTPDRLKGKTLNGSGLPNHFLAKVLDAEEAGGTARVDLDLSGERLAVLMPVECWRELGLYPGSSAEVHVPSGAAVITASVRRGGKERGKGAGRR